ncbi:MAG TPA: LacI family DNA-binding transcriptional regulator [Sphingomonas sp.]|nr:LacI family DNA-binding transcriptional regulator [Sphingomonas sp.]
MAAVAVRAGVSAMTVSNVINDTGRVAEATRRRVRAAIDELGYMPDPAAKHLASAGATRMGVIYRRSRSEFVADALVSALDAVSARGVQLLVHDCAENDVAQIEAGLRTLVRQGARSLLLLPPFAELVSGRPIVTELGLPVAAIGTGRALIDMATVRIDDRAAACAMTELLLDQGHRRIGFISGPPSHSGAIARREGFTAALRGRGLAPDPALIAEGDYNFDSGLAAAATLLDRREKPTAIFASNDEMAAAVAWVAHSRGLTLPDDLAIAGFDDAPIATRVFPALTAIRQPVATIAARATELLIAAMREGAADSRDELVPFELVVRQSTAKRLL